MRVHKIICVMAIFLMFGCSAVSTVINPQTLNVAAMTMQAIQLGYVALCNLLQVNPSPETILVVQKVDASLDALGKLINNQKAADTTVDKVLAGAEDSLNLMRLVLNKNKG